VRYRYVRIPSQPWGSPNPVPAQHLELIELAENRGWRFTRIRRAKLFDTEGKRYAGFELEFSKLGWQDPPNEPVWWTS
jgi:hypothetical protein